MDALFGIAILPLICIGVMILTAGSCPLHTSARYKSDQ